nr:MFS transporter [Vagococcus hydrophili]
MLAIICEAALKIEKNQELSYQGRILEVVKHDSKEVARFLKQNQVVVQVCLIAFLLNFLMTSFIQVLVPYLARLQMGISDNQFGMMNTTFAIGGLVGAVLYSVFGKQLLKISLVKLLNAVAVLFAGLVIPYYYLEKNNHAFLVMVSLVTVILALVTMISIQLVVYIQLVTEQKLLGRVMSFVMIISTLAIPAGQVLFGSIGNILTPVTTAMLCVFITIFTVVIAFLGRNTFKLIQKTSIESQ